MEKVFFLRLNIDSNNEVKVLKIYVIKDKS